MAEILELCASLEQQSLAEGETLLAEGQRSTGALYVLADGMMEVRKGDVEIALVSEPGAFFGEMSLLLDVPYSATVSAVTASRCYVARDGRAFLESTAGANLAVAKLLARRLHAATSYLADLKRQYEAADTGLAVVDEVLEALTHQQASDAECEPGSDRDPNL